MKIFLSLFIFTLLAIYNIHACCDKTYFRVSAIRNLLKNKRCSCVNVVKYFLKRAHKYNPKLKAIINFNSNALKEAAALDEFYLQNKTFKGKLHCIPILVKDNIDVAGMPSTGGLNALRYSIPNKDALIVERLKLEGGIVIAKANMAELGRGQSYDSETGGMCRNPWNLKRSCGISSSGTGAGISSGMAIIGIGTDTEGSIIEPSSFNGLFGLRPPHDFELLNGVIPGLQRFDTVGPMTKYLDDLVLAYSIMINDTSLHNSYMQSKNVNKLFQPRLKIGVLKQFFSDFDTGIQNLSYILNKEIKEHAEAAIKKFRKLGNTQVVDVEINATDYELFANIIFRVINEKPICATACAKLSFNQYFNDTDRFRSDSPIKNFLQFLYSPLLSQFWGENYQRANVQNPIEACENCCKNFDIARDQFEDFMNELFNKYEIDVLVYPSTASLPFILDPDNNFANFVDLSPTFFSPYSRYSALNVPIGFSEKTHLGPYGLPIGLTLLAPKAKLLNSFNFASQYEKVYFGKDRPILPKSAPLIENDC